MAKLWERRLAKNVLLPQYSNMEYDRTMKWFVLQPNEVLEAGQLRVTNISKRANTVTLELLDGFDYHKLTTGPLVEKGLEYRLRVE